MSVVSEIERIKTNIANAYTEIENKGVITTAAKNSENLASTISAIQTGGTGGGSGDEELINSYIGLIDNSLNILVTKLPDGITRIAPYTFYNRSNITDLSLPDSITSINNYAFYNCTRLNIDKLPDSLTTLGSYVFQYCNALNIKVLPSGVTSIPTYCFQGSYSMTELTCLGNITNIENYSFYGCTEFSKLVLPNITSVPKLANKNALTSTKIYSGTGYIFVPDTLVDSFKSASNWSNFANVIKPISELGE